MSDDDEEECDCPPEGAPAWMATFSDMATLMLCFFVLLLSFANMDVQNFRTALGSVKEAFGVQFKVRGHFQAMSTSPVELSTIQSAATLYQVEAVDHESMAIVEEFIRSRGLESSLEVDGDPRGVIVRAKDRILFDSGQAVLKDDASPMLQAIGELFEEFTGTLAIEGHTDNRPINTPTFPSNWELSGARAATVLRYMVKNGLDIELAHIAGYADMRPVASNATAEGRAKNRRVEFVFEYNEEYDNDPSKAFDVKALNLDDEKIKEDAADKRAAAREKARKEAQGQSTPADAGAAADAGKKANAVKPSDAGADASDSSD